MWYTAKRTATAETKQEKKLREARRTLKWIPLYAVLTLFVSIQGIVKYVQHPNVEHLLNLISPFGLALTVGSYWKQARATLSNTSDVSYAFPLLLGILLSAISPTLKDMWHHRQMFLFYLFGTPVLALALFCMAFIVWDGVSTWKAKRQSTQKSI